MKFTCFTGTKVQILTLTRLAGDARSETPLFDKTSSPYKNMAPKSGGGGGSGGSIWIIAPRIIGHGVVSATGGTANRSCHTVPSTHPPTHLLHSLPPSLPAPIRRISATPTHGPAAPSASRIHAPHTSHATRCAATPSATSSKPS